MSGTLPRGLRRTRLLAPLAAAAALAASGAPGDVWRTPEVFPPATGPAVLSLAANHHGRSSGSLSEIEVQVTDHAGRPVNGIAVQVYAHLGRKEHERLSGATGADGRLRLVDARGAKDVTFTFMWDAGAKTVDARLEPSGKAWRVVSAPYTRILDRKDEGSCRNLFVLTGGGSAGRYRLAFHRPDSLLECEEVEYGSDRHVAQLIRLQAIGHRDVNVGDKNMFSEADEAKMGLEASEQFDQQFEMITDPEIVGYVQQVMQKVIAASDEPEMPIHLRVVHTDEVNAFVTAGGHVYVFTGLFKVAQNESQIAGVLAHEASHAIARHATEGATRNVKAQTGTVLGTAALAALFGLSRNETAAVAGGAGLATSTVLLRYDRQQETEADLLGTQYLWNAGWDPEAIARFFELMQHQAGGGGTPAWLSTHPSDEKRVENGILWARAFLPPRDRYLVDTAAFERVKAKVLALPPPRKGPSAAGGKGLHELMAETPTWRRIVEGGTAGGASPPH